jgi:hypothetical protein
LNWPQYLPCDLNVWRNATNEHDFQQVERLYLNATYDRDRNVTGFYAWGMPARGACFALELARYEEVRRVNFYR